MARAKVRHPDTGQVHYIELDGNYSKEDRRILESLGIIETEKPKKKYKNVKQEKDTEDDE